MSENSTGHEDRGLDRDPLDPVTRGLAFLEEHHRLWRAGDNEFVTPEALAALRGLVDQVVIVHNLPEHVEVDPSLKASTHSYPPMRSEMPLPSLGGLLSQLHLAYGQPDNSNPAPGHA